MLEPCSTPASAAVGFVAAVLTDEVDEVLRRDACDRNQRTEIHQQAAVAIEHNNLAVRQAYCEAKGA